MRLRHQWIDGTSTCCGQQTSSYGSLYAIVLLAIAPSIVSSSEYNETEAKFYMQLARAAYCKQARIEHWNCGDMCESALISGAKRFLGKTAKYKMQGFVAVRQETQEHPAKWHSQLQGFENRRCIAAFRGSIDVQNWVSDLQWWQKSWPDWYGANVSGMRCSECQVHTGFAEAYGEIRESMIREIRDLRCKSITFTGHSLGAALATLASFEVRSSLGILVESVWAFGKPRVGNSHFASAYNAAAARQGVDPPMWRVVHYRDPIPRLPPPMGGVLWNSKHQLWNYKHESTEVFYGTRSSNSLQLCASQEPHLENFSCSWACDLVCCSTSDPVGDHNFYLNMTTDPTNLPTSCTEDIDHPGVPPGYAEQARRHHPFQMSALKPHDHSRSQHHIILQQQQQRNVNEGEHQSQQTGRRRQRVQHVSLHRGRREQKFWPTLERLRLRR